MYKIGHLYNSRSNIYKKQKVKFFSSSVWRACYLIKSNPIHHSKEKKLWGRNSTIPFTFIGHEVTLHAGKRWHIRRINSWSVGFKCGELTWNRKLAIYKAKQLRKKSKK